MFVRVTEKKGFHKFTVIKLVFRIYNTNLQHSSAPRHPLHILSSIISLLIITLCIFFLYIPDPFSRSLYLHISFSSPRNFSFFPGPALFIKLSARVAPVLLKQSHLARVSSTLAFQYPLGLGGRWSQWTELSYVFFPSHFHSRLNANAAYDLPLIWSTIRSAKTTVLLHVFKLRTALVLIAKLLSLLQNLLLMSFVCLNREVQLLQCLWHFCCR